jgi:hypothetical protein
VFGFDASYFKYFARDAEKDKCPNIIYVATTRSLENLTLIHSCDQPPLLSSITYDEITKDPNIAIIGGIMGRDEFGEICPKFKEKIPIKVTELIRFLDPKVIHNAIKMLDYITLTNDNHKPIQLPQKAVCTKNGTAEIVYDINGYAIPTYFEMVKFQSCSLLNAINIHELDKSQSNNYNKISFKFGQENILPINHLLYISTLYDATLNGYKHRTKQIASYDWLKQDNLDVCFETLNSNIGVIEDVNAIKFEYYIKNCPFVDQKYTLNGVIDILDYEKGNVWEIKCTTTIDNEHIIQMAIYAWMLFTKENIMMNAKLLNVCRNEVVQLVYDHEKITSMIEYLLKSKYEKRTILTDTEFIKDCLEVNISK